MADFDPDAYLASKEEKPAAGFDPDAYLASKGAATSTREPSWYDKAKSLVTGEKFDPNAKPGYVQDIVQSLPGVLPRASAGFAGLLQTASERNPLLKLQQYVAGNIGRSVGLQPQPRVDIGAQSLSGIKQLMGSTYQDPQTTPGKIADFAAQNVLFGAKSPKDLLNAPQTVRSLVSGTAAGAAGELVPEDMPKLKMAAQMVGGFSPSLVETALKSPNRATKNAATMIKQAMQGKSSAEWAAAEHLVSQSQSVGVPLMGPEGFKGGSQIQQLASDVAASPAGGAKLREFTQDRPAQVQQSVKAHLAGIGADVGAREAANQAEVAATKVITHAEGKQTADVKPYYDAAANDRIPDTAAAGIVGKIDRAMAADKTGILSAKLGELRKSLTQERGSAAVLDAKGNIVTQAKPEKLVTDIENLDRARKYFRDKIELPTLAPDAIPKEVAATMGPILADIRKEMVGASANFARGKALYQRIQETKIDPLMKGPVGNVAGKGADAQREAAYTRVMNEISAETATPTRISKLADELKTTDKTAFPNVARAYLEAKLNTSLKDLQGRRNPMAGANFRNAVEGTPQEAKNLRAIIQKTAEAQGQDGAVVYQGFGKLLDVLDATGRVPGMGSQTQSRMENAAIARSNPISGAIESVSTTPTKRIAKWVDDMVYRGTYAKLAEVFTAKDSIQKMQKLAELKSTSPEARNIVSVMLTSAAQGAKAQNNSSDDAVR